MWALSEVYGKIFIKVIPSLLGSHTLHKSLLNPVVLLLWIRQKEQDTSILDAKQVYFSFEQAVIYLY